ncbi:29782_t:CDS:2, partial [Gigaspora margarita]
QDFGKRQTSISKINFKLDVLQDYYDKLEPLVDSSVIEGTEIKLYSNCAIKKKEALFNFIRQLQYSINKKLKE